MSTAPDTRSKQIEGQLREMRKDPVRYFARVRAEEARKQRRLHRFGLLKIRHRTV